MSFLKKTARILLPLTFGVIIFWWVYHKMDFHQIADILSGDVKYQWFVVSVALGVLSHVLRAVRWRMLIMQLGIRPSVKLLTNAVFINYGANLVLPRLGEVWRCIFVAQKKKTTFTKIFGTLIAERVVDMLLVMLMVLVGMFTMLDLFTSFIDEHFLPHIHFHIAEHLWIAFFGAIGLIIFVMVGYRLLKRGRIWKKIVVLLHEITIGIKTVLILPHKAAFFALSILIWLCYLIQLYVCFFAFGFTEHLGLGICFSMFVMGSIAFALPVQGGIGPWHFMVIATMVFYGVDPTEAAAFALIVHTLQTLVSAVTGGYAFLSTGANHINKERV